MPDIFTCSKYISCRHLVSGSIKRFGKSTVVSELIENFSKRENVIVYDKSPYYKDNKNNLVPCVIIDL